MSWQYYIETQVAISLTAHPHINPVVACAKNSHISILYATCESKTYGYGPHSLRLQDAGWNLHLTCFLTPDVPPPQSRIDRSRMADRTALATDTGLVSGWLTWERNCLLPIGIQLSIKQIPLMERYRVLSSIGVQCCKRSYPQQNNIHCIFEFGAVLGC